jgi:hypothetical protein
MDVMIGCIIFLFIVCCVLCLWQLRTANELKYVYKALKALEKEQHTDHWRNRNRIFALEAALDLEWEPVKTVGGTYRKVSK